MGKVAMAAKIVCTAAVCAAAVVVARRQMKSSGRWAKAEAILRELEENCGCPMEKLRQVADAMTVEMHAGLASEGGSKLKMLISYVDNLPTGYKWYQQGFKLWPPYKCTYEGNDPRFYSGVVAGAREALINGVPSISISLNWKNDGSEESDFKDAVTVCLPIINAAARDIEKGIFPKGFSLDIQIPTSPSANKGIKVTKRSHFRYTLCWQAISGTRNQAASRFGGGQPGIGMQFAQLGRDSSAAGAARRLATQKKNIEVVESVGAVEKPDFKRVTKYFCAEMLDKEQNEEDEDLDLDLDFRALGNGFRSKSSNDGVSNLERIIC
ncbi:hypothetical protein CASFOL_033929 [Castilleja foliolosa]|uniref:Uncharacterized protein n=1 Tax=Castilleja foliolosa TaxID=1961234 RepID=A0ABD3BZ75_9LAMI